MNKQLFILCLLSALNTSAIAGWLAVDGDEQSTTYVDMGSIRRVDGFPSSDAVSIKDLVDYKMNWKGYKSIVSTIVFSCSQGVSYGTLGYTTYYDNMGEGLEVETAPKRIQRMAIVRGSALHRIYQAACQ